MRSDLANLWSCLLYTSKESGELVLHNYMDFDDLKDYVKISYELTQDGLVISKGKLPEVSSAPHLSLIHI